ncbi:hypothetical protein MYX82_12855 [Acidobacteria bacterium AH-259-D05]|nr:hypothetical protein [Acidobacteria bacterium AH-259-D05]
MGLQESIPGRGRSGAGLIPLSFNTWTIVLGSTWGHDGCHPFEPLAADVSSLCGESPSRLVCQPEPTAFHLLLQDSVLLDQVLNDVLFVVVHSA